MTRDQIQKRIEMIIEEEFFKYQDSLAVQRSTKRIMKWWDNGFVYELKPENDPLAGMRLSSKDGKRYGY